MNDSSDVTVSDRYRLRRFVDAQRPVVGAVERELGEGRKRSHWMWFVFPQIEGLGHSAIAREFAIDSLDEARAYLRHPVLGKRLIAMTRQVTDVEGRSAHEIFSSPDDMKFHSSMTLFALACTQAADSDATSVADLTDARPVFMAALRKYYGGAFDAATLSRLPQLSGLARLS